MAGNASNIDGEKHGASFAASVLDRYHLELHRFLMRRLRSDQDVKDLAQEVYLRLLRVENASQILEPLAYVYRTAANVVVEFQMRRQRERVQFNTETLEQRGENPAELLPDEIPDRLSTERAFQRALGQLPPMYRTIFLLRLRDGLDYADIARSLDLSVHTVRKYFFRSVGMIRAVDWD